MKRKWIALGLAGTLWGPGRAEVEELYLDADDGGRHAVLSAALEGEAGRESLLLRIRPHGPGVEREGGWRSREGINAHTARELESVLRAEGFEARLRRADGSTRSAAVIWEKDFGTFPRRQLRLDWSIDYLARTEPLVRELRLQTAEGLEGTEALELLARGEPRLLLEFHLAEGRITGLAMPGHSRTVAVETLVAEQEEVKPLVLPGGWQGWDGEAKWKWFRGAVGEGVVERGRFVEALRVAKDWTFLEQLALYVPGAYGTHSIGVVLHAGQAPNWRRAAAWFHSSSGGHGAMHTASLLAQPAEKAKSLGWLQKYPKRLEPKLKALQAQWEMEGLKPEEPAGDLPPLIEDDVFAGISGAFLKREGPLDEAAIAPIARGIEGWAVSERWGSPWGDKVVDLIEDPDWRIAQAACLAFTHGSTKAVPSGVLWKVAHDETKDSRLREAAFLAWSYGDWGEVFKVLHEVAEQPQHALWMPAASRLGELGNGWTLVLLEELAGRKGPQRPKLAQRRVLKQETEILRERFGKRDGLSRDFESTVWAIVLGYDRSADMEEWMLDTYGEPEWDTQEGRKALASPRGWGGPGQPPKVLAERIAVRNRLIEELEFRWKQERGAAPNP